MALIGAGFGAWALYDRLQGNITRDDAVIAELERHEKERPLPSKQGALNILLVGSDTRAGQGNGQYGAARGQRSDTVILLHLAADRRSATAMSVPRDLMVEIPSCRRADGRSAPARTAQFNYAYSYGGTACTIRTVERLTRIRVDHHMVVDFQGFKRMVDAVDGVRICLKQPMDDKDAHVRLPAGEHTLNGEQSLGFVRARKSLGDGSDTDRMERQQQFLGALVAKVQSNGVLLNPGKLYPLLDAATSSLTTDPSIASLIDLYDLVRSMRNIPTKEVRFLTVPREAYAGDPNRDQLVEPAASELFTLLREDEPVRIAPRPNDSASPAPSASPTGTGPAAPSAPSAPSSTPGVRSTPVPDPTFSGNSAARSACE
ncbi:LytR family transcriptional regulator [Streptomyces albidoflavus]|uniref:LCP family protein n=1 Tax=Streptomyces odorifer TaxID=53450 RepID=A0A7Y6C7Q6_9ACTN|nr:LCP family protein [Streptomyces albidoflavus]MBV1954350.1 LCP family protein [Streptomyces sp. BV333]NUV27789.1 LCP family protein [Streptomyces odorifer]NUV33180.1 LCP family protein [Streptomyces sp. KAI-27]NUV48405.1 LCP family protein [Streptomyces sp. CAI-78]